MHMPHTLPLPVRATIGPLGRRLLVLFIAVLALSLVGSAIGLWSLLRIGQSTDDMVQRSVTNERLVADAYRLQAINAERYKAVALSSEPEVGETLGADIAETQRQYDALIDTLARRLAGTADEERLAQVNTQAQAFHQARAALVQARDFGLTQRIREVYETQFLPASQGLLKALDALTQSQRQSIDAAALRVAHWSWRARLALVAFGALSLVLGTLLALWLVRSITRPIALASDTANRVAGLDLRHDITGHDRDETGHMLSSLAVMQTALRHLAQQVRASVYSLHTASTDMASGNANLSERTEQAAASLQETAAALEHVKRALQASAETAHHTEARAAQAAAQARQGQDVVAHVVDTMQDISTSAHKIADITGMIDAIAFQTNILALNAAVEAARAGEQGRCRGGHGGAQPGQPLGAGCARDQGTDRHLGGAGRGRLAPGGGRGPRDGAGGHVDPGRRPHDGRPQDRQPGAERRHHVDPLGAVAPGSDDPAECGPGGAVLRRHRKPAGPGRRPGGPGEPVSAAGTAAPGDRAAQHAPCSPLMPRFRYIFRSF